MLLSAVSAGAPALGSPAGIATLGAGIVLIALLIHARRKK
jgi:hypothetical protein